MTNLLSVANPKTKADSWFETYLFATTPITDRLTAMANPNTGVSVISVSDKEMFGAVRRQVQEAAKTLKPFAACGRSFASQPAPTPILALAT